MTSSPPSASPDHVESPDDARLADLDARLAGRVLRPGSEDYPALATPWNVAVVNDHLAAVEVANPQDVVVVLRFAAEQGLRVVVRATGHGAYATAGGSLLLLTHRLDEVSVDPATRTARVGAGVTWARVLEAGAAHGLAGLAGSAPGVGVVGYVTGGGIGPVARTFGWSSDRVTAFDVVTGDGTLRRASDTENADLYWGLRGSKGALGIVTAVEMELLPLTEIYAGCLYFDGADAGAVLGAWRAWAPALPDAATTSVAVRRLPDLPGVPPPLAGRTTVAVRYAWVGDPADGQRAVAPMRDVAPVVLGGIGVLPYAALGSIHADPVDPMPGYEAAALLRELPDAALETLLARVGPDADCPQSVAEVRLLGGALAAAPAHPSALCHRDAAFTLMTIGLGVPPVVEAVAAHASALLAAMAPWSTGGSLPNLVATGDPRLVAAKYDADTLARLRSLVATYDPHRVLVSGAPFRQG
jgi:FAD/FMN-containing dehydrogenase